MSSISSWISVTATMSPAPPGSGVMGQQGALPNRQAPSAPSPPPSSSLRPRAPTDLSQRQTAAIKAAARAVVSSEMSTPPSSVVNISTLGAEVRMSPGRPEIMLTMEASPPPSFWPLTTPPVAPTATVSNTLETDTSSPESGPPLKGVLEANPITRCVLIDEKRGVGECRQGLSLPPNQYPGRDCQDIGLSYFWVEFQGRQSHQIPQAYEEYDADTFTEESGERLTTLVDRIATAQAPKGETFQLWCGKFVVRDRLPALPANKPHLNWDAMFTFMKEQIQKEWNNQGTGQSPGEG